jgi:CDGSH-type Zn-finger protein
LNKLLKINTFSKFPIRIFSRGKKTGLDLNNEKKFKSTRKVSEKQKENNEVNNDTVKEAKNENKKEVHEEKVAQDDSKVLNSEFTQQEKEKIEPIDFEPLDSSSIKEKMDGNSITDLYNINSKKLGAKNPSNFIDTSRFENSNYKLSIFSDEKFFRSPKDEFIPVSPRLGPYEVVNPQLEGKTYHWCACGMSNKQPFCDGSHRNGKIRPISFKLGEKVDSMLLCGCKLSKVKPFCDRKTCLNLSKKEEEEINKIVAESNQQI